jgi:hypothetical protein
MYFCVFHTVIRFGKRNPADKSAGKIFREIEDKPETGSGQKIVGID